MVKALPHGPSSAHTGVPDGRAPFLGKARSSICGCQMRRLARILLSSALIAPPQDAQTRDKPPSDETAPWSVEACSL